MQGKLNLEQEVSMCCRYNYVTPWKCCREVDKSFSERDLDLEDQLEGFGQEDGSEKDYALAGYNSLEVRSFM